LVLARAEIGGAHRCLVVTAVSCQQDVPPVPASLMDATALNAGPTRVQVELRAQPRTHLDDAAADAKHARDQARQAAHRRVDDGVALRPRHKRDVQGRM